MRMAGLRPECGPSKIQIAQAVVAT
jgi:hypothetical protein